MPSQGPRNGTVFENDNTIGVTPWYSLISARYSDDDRAFADLSPGQISNYLKATGFGFTIPSHSIIKGIQVDVENHHSSYLVIKDYSVKIVKGGNIQGDEKAKADNWGYWDTYITYGGPSDMWGLTWTANDINASNFGFVISAQNFGSEWNVVAYIDHIRITVYYMPEHGTTPDGKSYGKPLRFGAFPGIPQRKPYTL